LLSSWNSESLKAEYEKRDKDANDKFLVDMNNTDVAEVEQALTEALT